MSVTMNLRGDLKIGNRVVPWKIESGNLVFTLDSSTHALATVEALGELTSAANQRQMPLELPAQPQVQSQPTSTTSEPAEVRRRGRPPKVKTEGEA